jgi:hypothetical protein
MYQVLRIGVSSLGILWLAGSLPAEDKKLPIEHTSNELAEISATVILDKEKIKQALGSDFGGDMILVSATVRPVSDKPIKVSLDDFLLISAKDGQRAEPYSPSMIAGSDVLVVTRQGVKQGPGFGVGIGGIMGGGGGGGAGGTENVQTKMEKGEADKPNPLLEALKAKMLPEKEITETESGYLYFQIVGKVKPKDLELHYKGPAGKMALRFHP